MAIVTVNIRSGASHSWHLDGEFTYISEPHEPFYPLVFMGFNEYNPDGSRKMGGCVYLTIPREAGLMGTPLPEHSYSPTSSLIMPTAEDGSKATACVMWNNIEVDVVAEGSIRIAFAPKNWPDGYWLRFLEVNNLRDQLTSRDLHRVKAEPTGRQSETENVDHLKQRFKAMDLNGVNTDMSDLLGKMVMK